MTPDLSEESIVSADDFQIGLESLIAEAQRNGVRVEGAWICRYDSPLRDWEAVIVELEKT